MNITKEVKKILFITLSNIGDVILTLPVLDLLRGNFSQAEVTVMVGPRPKEIFSNNPAIDKMIVYDKHSPLGQKIRLFKSLNREKFDLVVDLRNSLFGALLTARYRTPAILSIPRRIKHMRERHLYKIQNFPALRDPARSLIMEREKCKMQKLGVRGSSLYISPQDEEYLSRILRENGISDKDKIIVVAAGARSQSKRWKKEKFRDLIAVMAKEVGAKVILVGDKEDVLVNKYITGALNFKVLDLSAQTSLTQLGFLLKQASLLITNDSAVAHLASYLNIPVAAIFGPTDENKYRPWSERSVVIKKDIFCRPCSQAQCRFSTWDCLRLIQPEDVIRQITGTFPVPPIQFKRILIVRTDRIGDVVLSTPVIRALRENYPQAYLAMLVSPACREIVEGNPYLDEVMVYDKDKRHRGWYASWRFAIGLKKKRFDLALILHPTNRVHLLTFFAAISQRLGYNRKMGFLLTHSLAHTKQEGQKHESEYNLDLLRFLGITIGEKKFFMPVPELAEKQAAELLLQEGLKEGERLLVIHPGASCPSKIWPAERFAQVAIRLAQKHQLKVAVVSGPKDIAIAQKMVSEIPFQVIDLAGKISLGQLAGVLKKCQIFISNDSGPVHIASALGIPVVSIFGRNQKGLSPKRWGPQGAKDIVLHKEVGCVVCLAHNCKKDFACLKAISVEEVVSAAERLLAPWGHP